MTKKSTFLKKMDNNLVKIIHKIDSNIFNFNKKFQIFVK
jgi:hypothetical protein